MLALTFSLRPGIYSSPSVDITFIPYAAPVPVPLLTVCSTLPIAPSRAKRHGAPYRILGAFTTPAASDSKRGGTFAHAPNVLHPPMLL